MSLRSQGFSFRSEPRSISEQWKKQREGGEASLELTRGRCRLSPPSKRSRWVDIGISSTPDVCQKFSIISFPCSACFGPSNGFIYVSIVVAFGLCNKYPGLSLCTKEMFAVAQNFGGLCRLFIDFIDVGPTVTWPCIEKQNCSTWPGTKRERDWNLVISFDGLFTDLKPSR